MIPISQAIASGVGLFLLSFLPGSAVAGVTDTICNNRPSAYIGDHTTSVIEVGAGGVAVAGTAAQVLGFYTLTNAATGLTMLGSTMAGSSAAGTIGIIGGTGGAIGAGAAFILAPATILTAAATTLGVSAWEGACLFKVERITDYDAVHEVMERLADAADPSAFRIGRMVDGRDAIIVGGEDGDTVYAIEDLYIADGILKSHDWFINTTIGKVDWAEVVPTPEPD